MRILHVIPFLWSGAGNVLTRLCLSQREHNDVAIVTSGESKGLTDWPEYRKKLKAAGIEHFQIDMFDREPRVFWQSVDAFAKLTQTWKPDITHCHSGVPACAAAVSGTRFIAQLHSWGVGRPDWMNTMDLNGFRQAERVLCSSIAYQNILLSGGVAPGRIRNIPWGLDLAGIASSAAAPARLQRGVSTFRIGFLGRIEPRKGQLELAKAFRAFHRKNPHSGLEFIGPVADKSYRDEISAFVRTSNLGDAVKLRGRVTNPYPKLKNWNLFVSLSSDEGQGIAILEAMALGVPVLGRRVAGVEDYLRDRQTGVAVGSSSYREVAERMAWALHHRKDLTRIAARAKEMVEAEYNWGSTIQRMKAVYETVLRPFPTLD
jgi:glycosyltransferase involved in cell wall biosynthesis